MNQSDQGTTLDPFINTNTIPPYASGELDGLSFAIKDNIDVENEITGYGCPGWKETHSKSAANAICLEQLLSEGGLYKGKTKLDELAYSLIGVNPFYGTPINPTSPNRVPGGSSSGSASAVASKLVDFAIGTDTGGSTRIPANNCGVWGYRPSHGIISTAGVLALAPSFDTVGILAQSGEILEKVMQVLLAEKNDITNVSHSVFFVDDVFHISEKPILDAIRPFQKRISTFSAAETVDLASITESGVNLNLLFETSGILMSTEIWNTFGTWVNEKDPVISPETKTNLTQYAKSANRKDIQNCLYTKTTFKNKLNKFLSDGKILCFPTTVDLAPRLEDITPDFFAQGYVPRAMGVNAISGLSCIPQITIPVAEIDGIAIGLSFLAGYGKDMPLVNYCNQLSKNWKQFNGKH